MTRRFRARLRLFFNKIGPLTGLYFRISLCFAIGLVILATTSTSNFDTRFNIRGPQKISQNITLITISREDIISAADLSDHSSKNFLKSLKELSDIEDTFYWNPSLWEKALSKLESMKAKSIVLALDMGKEISSLKNKKKNIFWTQKDDYVPTLKRTGFYPDLDGTIRHFSINENSLPYRVAKNYSDYNLQLPPAGSAINFLGSKGIFPTFTFNELLKGKIPSKFLERKIVIITGNNALPKLHPTPVGLLNMGELLAHMIYNLNHQFWITQIPFIFGAIYLLFILVLSLWIIFKYPESVALAFLAILSFIIIISSTALFDLKAFWFPIEAPLALIIFTYVVITGYRLGESEKHSWKSEQELRYVSEVEGLKNNFLSLISHDLKNPLAKIQGIIDRLLTNKELDTNAEVKDDLAMIRRTSDELRQYITSILQLTKVEAREVKISKEVCDLNSIVEGVLDRLKPLADGKKITIDTQLEPLFSQELDRSLISEVLINLVENAIKYSDENSTVTIKTSEVDNDVKVEVIDQAGGIDQAELPKVFDKFFRGAGDKTIKVTGSGLGLYLVKYFIELHGGKVFIESQKGVGTKIGFTLPLETTEEEYESEFARAHR